MENIICIPYFSKVQRGNIIRELHNKQQKYSDLDNMMIYYIEYIGWDEPYTSRLLKEYYRNLEQKSSDK